MTRTRITLAKLACEEWKDRSPYKERYPSSEIILTYFVNESMLETLQANETPLTIDVHEKVAVHYDISSIHLAREVAKQILDHRLTWKQFGGVSSTLWQCNRSQHDRCSFWIVSPHPGSPTPNTNSRRLPEPIDPFNYHRGRFIPLDQAELRHGGRWGPRLGIDRREQASSIQLHPTALGNGTGSRSKLLFQGTAIGLFVVAGPMPGRLKPASTAALSVNSISSFLQQEFALPADRDAGQRAFRRESRI